ncbi:MAG: hypothetical protein K1X89_02525 [Myxococcaceae bacterium]|nr:hypothetical protein [Myxococcaceae bacterium]
MITLSLVQGAEDDAPWMVEIRGDGVSLDFAMDLGVQDWNALKDRDLELKFAAPFPPTSGEERKHLSLHQNGNFRLLHEIDGGGELAVKVHRTGKWSMLDELTLSAEARDDLKIADDDETLRD